MSSNIFDNLPINVDSNQNYSYGFSGFRKTKALTEMAENLILEKEKIEQENWMLLTVEQAIQKAAEEGKWFTSIPLPANYNAEKCIAFLNKAGYDASVTKKTLTISWAIKMATVFIKVLYYSDYETIVNRGNVQYTVTVPLNTVFNEDFLEEYCHKSLGGFGPNGYLKLDEYELFQPGEGGSPTEFGLVFSENTHYEVYVAYSTTE